MKKILIIFIALLPILAVSQTKKINAHLDVAGKVTAGDSIKSSIITVNGKNVKAGEIITDITTNWETDSVIVNYSKTYSNPSIFIENRSDWNLKIMNKYSDSVSVGIGSAGSDKTINFNLLILEK